MVTLFAISAREILIMFGYILPERPELKIREYEYFRAYYCGVCKSIAIRYGQLPRFRSEERRVG